MLRCCRPLLLILILVLAGGCHPLPAPAVTQQAARPRQQWLDQFARGYFPGRSGQVFLVPREGHFVVDRNPLYTFMHGSPWDYDTHIPLLFYRPHSSSRVRGTAWRRSRMWCRLWRRCWASRRRRQRWGTRSARRSRQRRFGRESSRSSCSTAHGQLFRQLCERAADADSPAPASTCRRCMASRSARRTSTTARPRR